MKTYFHTFGCKTNQYETEFLREKIISRGDINSINTYKKADICVINSCTVTHKADADCRQLIKRIARVNPSAKIIVTGCYAVHASEEIYSTCDRNSQVVVIPEKEGICSYLGFSLTTHHSPLITGFNGRTRAFIKIQDGCNAFCSYCIVPYVRPKLLSRVPEVIISEVRNLVSHGYREIVLTGIRLGKYQARSTGDEGQGLVDLLKELEKIERLCRIRLSSLEIHEVSEKLIKLMAGSKKICRHLHLPLQNGDDVILKAMNRPYDKEEFAGRIKWICKHLPDVGISTDVIVGFPGETEESFLRSYEFVEKMNFSRLHVFPYSLRPGTEAAKFRLQVPIKVKMERVRKFLELDITLRKRFREKFANQTLDVLLDKEEKEGILSGFTGNYIRLKTKEGRTNEIVSLKVSPENC